MNLSDLFLGSAGGGVLGILGGIATGVLSYFQKKQDHAFRLDELRLTSSLRQGELAGELAKAREQGASEAFTESVRADGRLTGEWRWVTSLRAFTRPGLTWYFTLLQTAIILLHLFGLFDLRTIEDPIIQSGVMTVFGTTGMMIAWWFGQRQMDKSAVSWGNKDTGASLKPKAS